ncbi:LytR/AlgR family response regulator transcription factor [Pedobacter sp. MR22-3]|uniref:LytR/AlgR family response regulator transcription factor n=1 Tax=Pedobacter sp. MR22-3 TaxID=2994552 RepID=UPI002247A441|nr:LytTR family DNA-binding domain-containing protein [Pedobacter sp. MR22-3]MCX2584705.1 LytTR family DNA-binding domain-containing protein [Pedobacter sp. MR22-3]
MHTSLVVDDDLSSLEIISEYISSQSNIKLIKTFSDPLLALKEIKKLTKPIDILFIDIEMPMMNGIELAKLIKHKARILIFTTAHTKYAFDSYELKADGYLLKPFSSSKFSQTLKTILSETKNYLYQKTERDFVILKSKDQKTKFIKTHLKDIIAIESQNKEIKIYTSDEIIFAYNSLSHILKLIEHIDNFVQIHKSYIVSQNHIKGIERKYVLLSNNLKIPIGRTYKKFYDLFF